MAKNPIAARKTAATDTVNERFRNRRSGTIGSTARDSTKTKASEEHGAEREQPADARVGPGRRLLVGQPDEDRHEGAGEQRGAEVVDPRAIGREVVERQVAPDHREHDGPDRQVDEEHERPADGVGDDAADGRPDEHGQAEHGAEQALVAAALGWREQVADDRERDREERAGAETLDAARADRAATSPATARPAASRP